MPGVELILIALIIIANPVENGAFYNLKNIAIATVALTLASYIPIFKRPRGR